MKKFKRNGDVKFIEVSVLMSAVNTYIDTPDNRVLAIREASDRFSSKKEFVEVILWPSGQMIFKRTTNDCFGEVEA